MSARAAGKGSREAGGTGTSLPASIPLDGSPDPLRRNHVAEKPVGPGQQLDGEQQGCDICGCLSHFARHVSINAGPRKINFPGCPWGSGPLGSQARADARAEFLRWEQLPEATRNQDPRALRREELRSAFRRRAAGAQRRRPPATLQPDAPFAHAKGPASPGRVLNTPWLYRGCTVVAPRGCTLHPVILLVISAEMYFSFKNKCILKRIHVFSPRPQNGPSAIVPWLRRGCTVVAPWFEHSPRGRRPAAQSSPIGAGEEDRWHIIAP